MLRKLDQYVIVSFAADFIVSAFALSGLFVMIDLFQRLGSFISLGAKGALVTIVRYYALFVPIHIPDMFPAITVVGAGMTLARHAKANELLAMKASGISLYRIVTPIFVCASLLALAATVNREMLVPKLWQSMIRLQRSMSGSVVFTGRRVRDKANNMEVRVWEFDRKKHSLRTIDIWQYYENGALKSWIKAKSGEWQGNKWHLFDVKKHDFSEDNKQLGYKTLQTYVLETSLAPKDLEAESVDPAAVGFFELKRLCREHPESRQFHVSFHSRIAYPLKSIVLLLIGIPFIIGLDGLNKSRFMGILNCVIVCAVFYTVGFVSSHFGVNGYLPPIAAAWIPTVMFGAVGLLLFDHLRT